jgi:BirA family biotin operon repressor/biotin-[acetyl-CoA-carboxylase] ligase
MQDIKYIRLKSVDSTNTYAKKNAKLFDDEFTVIQSQIQLSGRGRMDRTFISDNEEGAWFSLVIKPKKNEVSPKQSLLIPIMAALAVSVSIEELYELKCGIKWPNDILVNYRKVCGILCESQTVEEYMNFMIIGIGVNVNQAFLHKDIEDIATSLLLETKKNIPVDLLIQNICGNLLRLYDKIKHGKTACIIDKWNEYSLMDNTVITYTKEQSSYTALSKGIDMTGRLIIEQEGSINYLDSNEIRLKIQGDVK